jgi:hypothetical protein
MPVNEDGTLLPPLFLTLSLPLLSIGLRSDSKSWLQSHP